MEKSQADDTVKVILTVRKYKGRLKYNARPPMRINRITGTNHVECQSHFTISFV